ncbi:MAG: hypothetical protein JXR13_02135 [Thalassovita sp.]
MLKHLLPAAAPIALATGVCAMGAVGLMRTEGSAQGLGPWQGHYQRTIEDRFVTNLPLRDASIQLWTALKLGALNQTGTSVVAGADDWLFTTEEFETPKGPSFVAELTVASEQLALSGVQLLPVIIPDKARIYEDKLPHARGSNLEQRYAELQNILTKRGHEPINLQATLSALRTQHDSFLRSDTHWSPRGAEASAKAIAASLPALGDTRFETRFGPSQPFDGDLLTFLDTGIWRSWVGPALDQITPAQTQTSEASGPLFGDIAVPVALVGTSYSARADLNFAGFLRQALGADLLNFATEGDGPFVPMDRFLASEHAQNPDLKLVIWEIPERYISLEDHS